jgi:hypothetical protein
VQASRRPRNLLDGKCDGQSSVSAISTNISAWRRLIRTTSNDLEPGRDLADFVTKRQRCRAFTSSKKCVLHDRAEHDYRLKSLADDELSAGLASSVGRRNQITAEFLAYLAELDERQPFLDLGFASLFEYCVEALGLCESTARRHIAAKRVCRNHPQAFGLVASGALHASALSLLGKHLTPEHAGELFELSTRRSARQVEELLAARFPRPDVRDLVRRLPAPTRRTLDVECASNMVPVHAAKSSTTCCLGRWLPRIRLRTFGCAVELIISTTRGSTLADLAWKPQCSSLGSAQRVRVCARRINADVLHDSRSRFVPRFGGNSTLSAIPITTQITRSAGRRGRRTVAVPFAWSASSIHSGLMLFRKPSRYGGDAYVAAA